MTASNLTKQAVNGYVSAVGRSKNSLGVKEQCGGHNLPSVGIGLSCLSKFSRAVAPLPLQCLRSCVDLRLKCVHDIRWLNGWVDEVLFAKLGPHLLERNPFSFKNIHSFYLLMYEEL